MWKLLGIKIIWVVVVLIITANAGEGAICECSSCEGCNTQIRNLSCSEVRLVADVGPGSNCIRTAGRDNLVFDCTSAYRNIRGYDDQVFYILDSENFTLRRCRFFWVGHGESLRNVILVENSNATVEDIRIEHEISGAEIGAEIKVKNSTVRIRNSIFRQVSENYGMSRSIMSEGSNLTIINNRIEFSRFAYDLYSDDWHNSSGYNNMCKKPHTWNDTGTIGCKYWDYGVCRCWNCSDCNFKLNDGFCERTDLLNNISVSGDCLNWETMNVFNGGHFVISGDGTGIGLIGRHSRNITIRNFWRGAQMPLSRMEGVKIMNCTERGIEAAYVEIIHSEISGNRGGGINAARPVLQHTRVCDNGHYDIRVWHSCVGVWTNNTCGVRAGLVCNDEPRNPIHGGGCYRRCWTADPTRCGTNLTKYKEYYIRNLANVSNCFNITNLHERVAICLEGWIDGNDTGYAFRIINSTNITIKRCNITQFFNAIEIHRSRNVTIRDGELNHIRRFPLLLNHSSGEIINITFYENSWARGYKNISSNFTFKDCAIILNPWCIDDPVCTAALIGIIITGLWVYYRMQV